MDEVLTRESVHSMEVLSAPKEASCALQVILTSEPNVAATVTLSGRTKLSLERVKTGGSGPVLGRAGVNPVMSIPVVVKFFG